ncbi:MAG: AAA-like domain-containing protein [Mariniphaga sp.]
MKRFFNVTGFCNPERHYIIDPLRGLNEQIVKLIKDQYYFTMHAPRQSGKTTMLHSLMHKINGERENICLVFSLETAGYKSIPIKDANENIVKAIIASATDYLDESYKPKIEKEISNYSMKDFLNEWCRKLTKPLILLVDEIDSLYDDVLISILRQFRDGFQSRAKSFPSSVVLVGLRDVRDYKDKVRDGMNSMGSGSPFNIKAESLRLNNFTKEQVQRLLHQYTDEGGQAFSEKVIDLFVSYTGGQPWLVNALAREILYKILNYDVSKDVTCEIVDQAKENLIVRRDTHLDSLIDKLQNPRVKPIISALISGETIMYDEYNDDKQYVYDLGLIDIENKNGISISNQIYAEIIPRVLNANFQDMIVPIVERQWYIKPDGKLDLPALLVEFQDFYREHSESWLGNFSFQESGKQLLLMAFLQRIVNGGGKIDREMAVGRGRTDLLIEFEGDTFVLELKIKYSNYRPEKAYEQLIRYLDTVNQPHGYLVLFENKPSSEIPWENRIKWTELEHEWRGIKKRITLVEM